MFRAVDYWFAFDCDHPVLAGLLDETFEHCIVDAVPFPWLTFLSWEA